MALVVADRVQETSLTSGTGTLTLAGAVAGYQDFSTAIGNGNTTFYTIYDPTNYDWEVGIGTVGAGTLARTTVLSNSAGNTSPISLAGNVVSVFCTYPSEKSVNLDASGNVTPLGTIASGTWQGTTVGVSYGGTGVTASSGANSVVLRDADQNINVNSITQNLSYTTSAGGTTNLTTASSHFQILIGTSTQTYKLPDATSLPVGSSWVFDNDSTNNLYVTDNANGPVDTVAPGGYATVFLESNGTVAGEWGKFGMIPSEVNWGTNSLDLGGSTLITNGTWNGTTIGTAYGGTGLTSFSAANYALYSTSSSALTAGTLPVAAGGSGATTFTANGVLYGNGTSALGVTAVGATGEVLVGNTGAAPSWSTLSTLGVTSFSAGTTGLTPNTGTTGAVTLAGTLDVNNGGTGQTTYTDGQLLIGNTTGNTLTKATLTGTASQVDVTNGSGSITLSLPATINVNTSGSAATLTTARAIYGNNFNGSAALTQVIASTYGGTGNGFTKFTGPTTSEKTFTLPNASATILTDNAAVTVAQGGTGQTTYTNGQLLIGNTTGNTLTKATLTQGSGITITNGTGSISIANASPMTYPGAGIPNSTGSAWGTSYTTSGSGTVVALATSPTFTTSIDSGATFGAFASSTALTIGYTGTGASSTTNISTAALSGVFTKTINIGTSGTTSSTTAINIGSATNGTTTVRGALLVGAASASTTDGAIFATNNITAYAASDKKFKENIRDIPNALQKVDIIGGKLFDWSAEYIESMGGEHDYFLRKADAGVIAQDVEKAMPELVRTRDDGSLAVDYPKLVALAFAAIKELKAEIDELKGK